MHPRNKDTPTRAGGAPAEPSAPSHQDSPARGLRPGEGGTARMPSRAGPRAPADPPGTHTSLAGSARPSTTRMCREQLLAMARGPNFPGRRRPGPEAGPRGIYMSPAASLAPCPGLPAPPVRAEPTREQPDARTGGSGRSAGAREGAPGSTGRRAPAAGEVQTGLRPRRLSSETGWAGRGRRGGPAPSPNPASRGVPRPPAPRARPLPAPRGEPGKGGAGRAGLVVVGGAGRGGRGLCCKDPELGGATLDLDLALLRIAAAPWAGAAPARGAATLEIHRSQGSAHRRAQSSSTLLRRVLVPNEPRAALEALRAALLGEGQAGSRRHREDLGGRDPGRCSHRGRVLSCAVVPMCGSRNQERA